MANRQVILGKVETPIGAFGAVFTQDGLGRLTYPTEPWSECETWARKWEPGSRETRDGARLRLLEEELTAYFERALTRFSTPVDLRGTPFQVTVWTALQAVSYGEVRTYGQLASSVGRPDASRAVGAANGANPVPIVVPCHRIIGSNGRLVGYGGGLDMKRRLLELEGVLF
jgi:O-6-methylguanine DNA methyltransferase